MQLNESQVQDGQRGERAAHPLCSLSEEDLTLIAQLVLQSGSLKGLAEVYSVSYPTIRARLDRVIERLRAAMEGRARDPLREYLATLIERGQISVDTARRIASLAEQGQSGGQS